MSKSSKSDTKKLSKDELKKAKKAAERRAAADEKAQRIEAKLRKEAKGLSEKAGTNALAESGATSSGGGEGAFAIKSEKKKASKADKLAQLTKCPCCSKHCSLKKPKCGKGKKVAAKQAKCATNIASENAAKPAKEDAEKLQKSKGTNQSNNQAADFPHAANKQQQKLTKPAQAHRTSRPPQTTAPVQTINTAVPSIDPKSLKGCFRVYR